MHYVTLGRTGLRVSVMGLGGGGHSKLGRRTDKSHAESVALVKTALDLGVNIIDTAEAYGTEDIVGEAIKSVPRDSVVLSTKKSTWVNGPPPKPEKVVASLEASLKRLRTDYIDIYNLHGVLPEVYPEARDAFLPALLRMRDQGKIRFLGITEAFEVDHGHTMLQDALADDCWDMMMVGFSLLNQTARKFVFPHTTRQNVGTLIMFAVRRALSHPERLREIVADLRQRSLLDDGLDDSDPLGVPRTSRGRSEHTRRRLSLLPPRTRRTRGPIRHRRSRTLTGQRCVAEPPGHTDRRSCSSKRGLPPGG